MQPDCPLCSSVNERVLFTNNLFRIIYVDDEYYPGYIRLILNKHVAEMTDIDAKNAHIVFSALLIIENYMHEILNPDKINLASLGNMIPHLHWHIIPRYKNDRHFPNPIWGNITNAHYQVSNHLRELEKKLITSLSQEKYLFQQI